MAGGFPVLRYPSKKVSITSFMEAINVVNTSSTGTGECGTAAMFIYSPIPDVGVDVGGSGGASRAIPGVRIDSIRGSPHMFQARRKSTGCVGTRYWRSRTRVPGERLVVPGAGGWMASLSITVRGGWEAGGASGVVSEVGSVRASGVVLVCFFVSVEGFVDASMLPSFAKRKE